MNKPIHYATKLLLQYRTERGWSQQDMAQFLSLRLDRRIPYQTLQKWETGERGLTAEVMLELSKALAIPVMDLATRKS